MLRVLQARSLHNNPIQLANILVGALARSLSSNTSSFGKLASHGHQTASLSASVDDTIK